VSQNVVAGPCEPGSSPSPSAGLRDISLVEPGPSQATTHSQKRCYDHSCVLFFISNSLRYPAAIATLRGEQTIESQQLKNRQRLTVEALQPDAAALRSNPFVERHDGPDTGAVDRA
jgi:hypothetical protein